MPAISASAPAKSILFGEHAVVYQRPAIAIPISDLRSTVYITANPLGKSGIQLLDAPDIHLKSFTDQLEHDHPFRVAIKSVMDFYHQDHFPACEIKISSKVPIASGLGSSASVAVALIRALIKFLGQPLKEEDINKLAYNVEKIIHGNPSGVDNTVIAFEKPIFFVKDKTIEFLSIKQSLPLIIGNSGIKSLTREVVSQVRENWMDHKIQFEMYFDQIGKITESAKNALWVGNLHEIGKLMDENHAILKMIGVSCEKLNQLVEAAIKAGALGAKLCGSGQGGNMIALLNEKEDYSQVQNALLNAGATETYFTILQST
jgi:mevalonate kinase